MSGTDLWEAHARQWRDPAEVLSYPPGTPQPDGRLLRWRTSGAWWETLARASVTLLVSREYEHLLVALAAPAGEPTISYLPLPHPSGLAVAEDGAVYVASTRNPNQLWELRPATALLDRAEVHLHHLDDRPLVPVRSRVLPGSLYLHDLAFVGGMLHGNAVAFNSVVRFTGAEGHAAVWWPRCVERDGHPVVDRNLIQLNSIAAGASLEECFFSASTDRPSRRLPGHRNFAVDRRGVLFSGATREVVARGLTRPHSARFFGGAVWIDDSGYGRLVRVEGDRLVEVTRLRGWTRGLCFCGNVAFVGTSRVIPRFRHYAPGLEAGGDQCGIHAVDVRSGRVLGSLLWPFGNQVFAIEHVPVDHSHGLPYLLRRNAARERALFFAFRAGGASWSPVGC